MSNEVLLSESEVAPKRSGRDTPASITGVGAVTGFGWGRKHTWDGFLLGDSAVKLTPGFDGFVEGGAYVSSIAPGGDRRDGPSRFMQAVRFSAREAITDALERGWEPGPAVGLVHSVVLGDQELWSEYYRSGEAAPPRQWVTMMPSTLISMLMQEYGFHGPTMSVSAMCASGNAGILTAKSWIDSGIASDVIFLNSDLSLVTENIKSFCELGVAFADTTAADGCRPFQEGSRGFPGGEASVAMVLSNKSKGGYGSILGGALTMDAYNAVSIAPDQEQLFRCFREAIATSGISPSEVGYMNAHGPGTAQCDTAEAAIFDELFPEAHGIFSVKPLIGHCQAAASGVEILATLYAFQSGFVPAPRRVASGHPRLVDGHTPRKPGLMVKSSIGLGGFNSAIVLAAPGDERRP